MTLVTCWVLAPRMGLGLCAAPRPKREGLSSVDHRRAVNNTLDTRVKGQGHPLGSGRGDEFALSSGHCVCARHSDQMTPLPR